MLNDEKIVLIARLKVKKDAVENLKQAALAIVVDSRSEPGCVNYDIHQAIDDETVFLWHETWANKAALDEHFAKPYTKEFFARVDELAEESPQINLSRKITD
jgi:quinol monooxygenase YgiN